MSSRRATPRRRSLGRGWQSSTPPCPSATPMPRGEPTVFEREAPAAAVVDAALTGARDACLWTEDVASAGRHPRLSGGVDADLCVVGGGYTGLWTAVRAKERDPGRRVVLLEAE